MCKSLWPDITAKREETPKDILQQQANFLSENTNGKIVGNIEISEGSNFEIEKDLRALIRRTEQDLCYKLYITATHMGGVRFLLLSMLQNPIEIYPCHLKDEVNEVEYKDLENMDSFIARLKEILQSPKISTLLSNLI